MQGRNLMSLTLSSLRAVAFDLDDTLCARTAAAGSLFREWLGPVEESRWAELRTRDDRGHAPREPFFEWFTEAFPQLGLSPEEALGRFREELPRHLHPNPGAISLLNRLREHGLPLAILTNGGHAFQNAKMAATGLTDFFAPDLVLTASGLPQPKPSHAAFATLVQALKVPAGSVLFVGDDLQLDVHGARAAGLQACWLRDGSANPDNMEVAADTVVDSLTELTAMLFPEP